MGRKGKRLTLGLAGVAVLLVAATSAVGLGPETKPVRVAAPVESVERLVAYGQSKLLVIEPEVSDGQGRISRVNLDGSADGSFGDAGSVSIVGQDAAVTGDGKILVATTSNPGAGDGQSTKARVMRLLPDGQLDPSFGSEGHTDLHFGRRYDYGEAVATAANGDILLAGSEVIYASEYGGEERLAIARLEQDGSLDRSFGKGGVDLLTFFGEIAALDVTPTPAGGILVEGGNETESTILKLRRDGSIDRSFGFRGYREIRGRPLGDGRREELMLAPGVVVLPSGKLLLAATGYGVGAGRVVVVRLRPDGRVDRSYGKDGWAVVGKDSGWTLAEGSALLPGGDFVVATSFVGEVALENREFGAIAFRPDGRIDGRFGSKGKCRARLPGGQEATGVIDVGGRAVIGGDGYLEPWLLDCPPAPEG